MDSQLMEKVSLHEHPSQPAGTSDHWPDKQKARWASAQIAEVWTKQWL